jgi:hypothetical protein
MKVVQSLEELKCCLGLKLAHQGVKLVYHESCQPQLTHSFFLHKVYIYSLHRQQNNLQMEKAKLMHQALHPLFSLSFDDRLQIFDSNVSLTCPNLTHNLFAHIQTIKKFDIVYKSWTWSEDLETFRSWVTYVGYNSFVAEQVHAKTDVKKNL